MLQIVQNFKTGQTSLQENPIPQTPPGHILIQNVRSLVSLGTEKMLVSFAQSNYFQKALQQPERVKQVITKMQTDGIRSTLDTVSRKLDTPIPLGYSSAGIVVEVGKGVHEFKIGDRVVSNGAHAEYTCVPVNLAAKIPDNVSFDDAAFTVIGSIGLQGIRLAEPSFGETVVVIGLGLIGLITAQLLTASGCTVIGTDVDESKLEIAKKFGIKTVHANTSDPVTTVLEHTSGVGADKVIITASTKTNDIIRQSAEMSRKRGKIILVGVVGLDIDRASFYDKELTFQVSCSYGPGRYDHSYEVLGHDYPVGFVRWTEKRNFEAILDALSKGSLQVTNLITERVKVEESVSLYEEIKLSDSIASIIEYSSQQIDNLNTKRTVELTKYSSPQAKAMAIVGSGNFTQACILPALSKTSAQIKYLLSSNGLSSTTLARKYNIPVSSTDVHQVLHDTDVASIIYATRHNAHAENCIAALNAGKHVLVEKPLAISHDELDRVIETQLTSTSSISVGFNRRFSPHAIKIKELLGSDSTPMNIVATMNAGSIPKDHWVQDLEIGGGRIVGEACHLFDLLVYLSGSRIKTVYMNALGINPDRDTDNASITLTFENGSLGTVNYFSNGSASYPKERVEVFHQGRNLIIDNFISLQAYGFGKKKQQVLLKTKQDKGHTEQFRRFVEFTEQGGAPLIPFEDLVNVSRASLCALDSLTHNTPIEVDNRARALVNSPRSANA